MKKVKYVLGVLAATLMLGSLSGCENSSSDDEREVIILEPQEELDTITPNPEDADWYRKGIVYKSENGHSLEVFFDDDGMLQFAVDGLSLYFTTADNFQVENNWLIYTCDDGTVIVYYPGSPAHVEIMGGDYAGLYEAEKA